MGQRGIVGIEQTFDAVEELVGRFLRHAVGTDGRQLPAEIVKGPLHRVAGLTGPQGEERRDGQRQTQGACQDAGQRLPAIGTQAQAVQQTALAVAVVGQQPQVPVVGDAVQTQRPPAGQVRGGACQRVLLLGAQ